MTNLLSTEARTTRSLFWSVDLEGRAEMSPGGTPGEGRRYGRGRPPIGDPGKRIGPPYRLRGPCLVGCRNACTGSIPSAIDRVPGSSGKRPQAISWAAVTGRQTAMPAASPAPSDGRTCATTSPAVSGAPSWCDGPPGVGQRSTGAWRLLAWPVISRQSRLRRMQRARPSSLSSLTLPGCCARRWSAWPAPWRRLRQVPC